MKLEILCPTGRPAAYRYFWLKCVHGFRPGEKCCKCLVGRRLDKPSEPLPRFVDHAIRDSTYVYICGVHVRGYDFNLHAPLEDSLDAEPIRIEGDGVTIIAHGARRMEIPEMEDGAYGFPVGHTRCRNFRFGHAYLRERNA